MIEVVHLPKPLILKSPRLWSVEDRHQIRISLRRIRAQIRMVQKNGRLFSIEFPFIRELNGLAKDLLDCCGDVRDIDVLFETLDQYEFKWRGFAHYLERRRKVKIERLYRKWPLVRRKYFLHQMDGLIRALEGSSFALKEGEVSDEAASVFQEILRLKPKTKTEWHFLRRRLRRGNYLLSLLGYRFKKLVQIQKTLGRLHDLENLEKEMKRYQKKMKVKSR